ncbi:DUF2141 domain-containing protein [Flavobacterium aquicola]|uniref:Uncharacterized protein (DUF2141 family) n=1 Tax=Flavobacterium aquicola TaxID=1682742 RepID=A0A3E0EVK5_9FLAO|nr:DUF2141 domain-containing protein [Flavobacterium aquicola]REH01157.1 uncharacterized protein (DUF2141 family) [Flavobacterium aquicola]
MKKLFIGMLLSICSLGSAQNSTLTINVSSLKNNTGIVTAELYNSKENYLKTPFKKNSATIKSNLASITFTDIPKGEYTVKVYHDENNNGKLDKYIIGMPKEPVACSNNAKGFMGPPKYHDAKFIVSADTKMNIKMITAH